LTEKKESTKKNQKRTCPSCNEPGLVRKISIGSLISLGVAWFAAVDAILRFTRGGDGAYTSLFAVALFGAIGLVLWPSAGFRCKKCGAVFKQGEHSKC